MTFLSIYHSSPNSVINHLAVKAFSYSKTDQQKVAPFVSAPFYLPLVNNYAKFFSVHDFDKEFLPNWRFKRQNMDLGNTLHTTLRIICQFRAAFSFLQIKLQKCKLLFLRIIRQD